MKTPNITLLLVSLAAASCTSPRGFDRGALSQAVAPESIVTEEEIQRVAELRPQLPRPFKLGVYFRQAESHHWSSTWTWLPEDKELFLRVGESLKRQGVVADTIFISPATSSDEELKSIRLAGARHGVEAVLVVSGVSDVDRYNNNLGPSYALLVTALFVPGTVVDSMFVSHGALWDVRNGYLYASVEADGKSSATRPAAFAEEREVVLEAKAQSLSQLAEAVEVHVLNLGR